MRLQQIRDQETQRGAATSRPSSTCRRPGCGVPSAADDELQRELAKLRLHAAQSAFTLSRPEMRPHAGVVRGARQVGESFDERAAERTPAPVSIHAVHAQRRWRIASAMASMGGGVAIIPTAPERQRNGDSDFPFRYDSHFHHLTGFAEPHAWLVLDSEGRSTLFCREKDMEREIWDGFRLGPLAAPAVLGVDDAYPWMSSTRACRSCCEQRAVWFPVRHPCAAAGQLEAWLAAVRSRARDGVECPSSQRDLSLLLDEMRLVKDEAEIATMRRAAQITAGAHARRCAFAPSGSGAAPPASASTRSRPSCCTSSAATARKARLRQHRRRRRQRLRAALRRRRRAAAPGELCLVDAGLRVRRLCERRDAHLPGRRLLHAGAARALRDRARGAEGRHRRDPAGRRQRDATEAAVRVLSQGMLDCGLLDRNKVGDVEAVIASAAYRQFYMHGTGHWIGRDVHDVGEYLSLGEAPFEQPTAWAARSSRSRRASCSRHGGDARARAVRAAGRGVPERFWNIGIRIEDDAIVTAEGCELISRGVPVEAAEIEALMRG
jgi:Xaa-Pro aminopeptidase